MLDQIADARKTAVTKFAYVRLDARVHRRMCDQTLAMRKRFVAYITFEWFLASVTSLVHLQLATTEETFATKVAQVFLLARMDEHVCIQCVPRNEFRLALSARVASYGSAF